MLRCLMGWILTSLNRAGLDICHSDGGAVGACGDELHHIEENKMIGIGAGIMEKNLKRIGLTLLSAVSALFLYIFLHESGHLIVMLSAGATVTSFRILTAHVSAMGGEYTTLSSLWLHANGAILPMVAAFVYMLVYRKDCRKSFYRIFSFFVSLIPTASMLAWVILPFLFLQGNAPAKDDVTHFLNIFSDLFHPLIVSAVSAAIIVISITLIYKKGILQNYLKEVRQLKQQ